MARSTLELEMGLKGTTSKDEMKGGARIQDCIGIVEYFDTGDMATFLLRTKFKYCHEK